MYLGVMVLLCFFGFLMYVVYRGSFKCGFVYDFGIGFYGDSGKGEILYFCCCFFCVVVFFGFNWVLFNFWFK